ncbi:MAG: penicillin-binding protein 2 [Gemmatimonadetes bacterium]|nr:penicillin-binding protein 2 [Gemmatimonadota bacterium]
MVEFTNALRETRRQRARAMKALVAGLLLLLLTTLFRMQVLKHSSYALQSDENRLRAVPIPAPRGAIYDRAGRVVAENIPGYSVSILPASLDSLRAALRALAPTLGLTESGMQSVIEKYRHYPGRPVTVEGDASFAEVSAIEERRADLPGGIIVEATPKRRYPAGPDAAHVLGYVGEITEQELARSEFAGYEPGQLIGKMGLERQYERWLAGRPGVRYVEVNAVGRIVGEFRGRRMRPPIPGRDLHLNLDLELQRYVASVFPDTARGAVVVLVPSTGEVLALYSAPSFDPNAFVGGIDPALWRSLNTDPARSLFNRAIAGVYAPGSMFKLALAAIALAEGDATPETRMPIPCRGALLYYGRVFRCWRPEGHGVLGLLDAIKHSCDIYFYQLGLRLGLDRLVRGAREMGFTEATGIDLPFEASGTFPLGREWYDRRYGPRGWTNSVVLNLAIGQGENAQTPIKLAQFFSGIATDGSLPRPRLARSLPAEWDRDRIPGGSEGRSSLREAMVRVVNDPGGTARGSKLQGWVMAGKTGTSQNPHGDDHALFVGFAPAENPEVLAVAIIEFGQSGSRTAAPIVARILQRYLDGQHPDARPPAAPATRVAAGENL